MNIAKDMVVAIHYTLKNKNGEIVDSSEGMDPLTYLHGHGHIVPGLEEELEGKNKSDKFEASISAEKGYGMRNDMLVQEVTREMFGDQELKEGMVFHAESEGHPIMINIVKVDGDKITIDGNHPLAGEDLFFAIEVSDVREASKEELEHGHVHGVGGHQH
ncbi:MAG: peptidylprolyl isomerase [Bacteroidales bacterium]|nr:peptidylprolyl isomerase [Bacteroidales bacterium]